MPAKFCEAFANHGVDETATPPGMIVPLPGSNLVALTGGDGHRPVPDVKNIKIAEVDRGNFLVLSFMSDAELTGVPLAADSRIFEIKGLQPGETHVKAGDAKLTVRVLTPKPVKITVRPVQVRDEGRNVVFHAKLKFDIPKLVKTMNQIWTPQANVVFKLVSADPILVDEVAIAKAMHSSAARAQLPEVVTIADFIELFDGLKDPKADFTFFLLNHVAERSEHGKPLLKVRGATMAQISPIALIADERKDFTMAHEAGHLLGQTEHADPENEANAKKLMREGGPKIGMGKIPFNDVRNKFRPKP